MRMNYTIVFCKEDHPVTCLGPVLGSLDQVQAYANDYANENGLTLESIDPCTNTVVLPHSDTLRYMEIECGEAFWQPKVEELAEKVKAAYEKSKNLYANPDALPSHLKHFAILEFVATLSDEEALGVCYYAASRLDCFGYAALEVNTFNDVLKQSAYIALKHLVTVK